MSNSESVQEGDERRPRRRQRAGPTGSPPAWAPRKPLREPAGGPPGPRSGLAFRGGGRLTKLRLKQTATPSSAENPMRVRVP